MKKYVWMDEGLEEFVEEVGIMKLTPGVKEASYGDIPESDSRFKFQWKRLPEGAEKDFPTIYMGTPTPLQLRMKLYGYYRQKQIRKYQE